MDIKVMLVDDSPFSRTMLAATLEEMDCQIVGEADSLETLIQTYQECRPDIVMMDIAKFLEPRLPIARAKDSGLDFLMSL